MITACSHCSARYELPDKMLGRQARCKTCDRMFLIAPAPLEATRLSEERKRRKNTKRSDTDRRQTKRRQSPPPAEPTDPLDELAGAASGEEPSPRSTGRSASAAPSRAYEDDRPMRRRKARGAGLALGTGIAGLAVALAAGVCALIVMLSASNLALIKVLGPITILLVVIGIVLAMIAAVNGTSAKKAIRRSRHPLAGRNEASTGSILGAIAALLLFALILASSIWMINRGGITFTEVVTESEAN